MIVAARSRIPHISLWRLSRRHVASLPYLDLCNRSTLRLRLRNSAHGYIHVCMYEYIPRVSIYTVSTRLSCACTHEGESTGTEIGTGTGRRSAVSSLPVAGYQYFAFWITGTGRFVCTFISFAARVSRGRPRQEM
jgi:hypothetical protein